MADEQIRIDALEARIAELEATVDTLLDRLAAPATPQPPPPTSTSRAPVRDRSASLAPPPPRPTPPPARRAPTLDTETALKWGGVGLVVLAVGFAVSTAIQRGWIGPGLQLAGAVGVSLALIGAGLRLRAARPAWTHALVSGGVAALYATFASSLFLDQADADIAYVLTVVVGIAAITLARYVPSEWVAVVGLLGGVAAWLTIADGDAPFIETGAVFVVTIAVVVAVAIEREWFGLRLLTLPVGVIGVIGFAVAAEGIEEEAATLTAGALVAAVLLVVPSLGEIRPPWRPLELRAPAVLAPWAWLVIGMLFLDEATPVGLLALAVSGAVVALTLARWGRLLVPHRAALLVGASVAFTTGVGFVFATEVAWVAIAVQGAGLVLVGRAIKGGWLVDLNAGLLLVAAAVFAAVDGELAWTDDTTIGPDIARLAVIVAVAVGVWLSGHTDIRRVGALVVLGLVLVWLGSVLVHLPQGQAAVSLAWAIVGTAVLVAGAIRKIPDLGHVGLAVLALTVGKLLLVDMAEVDALWRAGLFFVVGLALLRLGFLLPTWTAADDRETVDENGDTPVEPSVTG